jgi:hypothetical protein
MDDPTPCAVANDSHVLEEWLPLLHKSVPKLAASGCRFIEDSAPLFCNGCKEQMIFRPAQLASTCWRWYRPSFCKIHLSQHISAQVASNTNSKTTWWFQNLYQGFWAQIVRRFTHTLPLKLCESKPHQIVQHSQMLHSVNNHRNVEKLHPGGSSNPKGESFSGRDSMNLFTNNFQCHCPRLER